MRTAVMDILNSDQEGQRKDYQTNAKVNFAFEENNLNNINKDSGAVINERPKNEIELLPQKSKHLNN